jgi:hypothetical protein
MEDQNRNMLNGDGDQHSKYRNYNEELKQVREYLTKHNATATMVSVALNIYRPNLCRQKRELEDAEVLIVTHRGRCKITGCRADYLSCNPEIVKGGTNG